mgnify:CR=1 FL=1
MLGPSSRLRMGAAVHLGLLLALVLGAAGASIVYWTIRLTPDWWWALSSVIFTVMTLHPGAPGPSPPQTPTG